MARGDIFYDGCLRAPQAIGNCAAVIARSLVQMECERRFDRTDTGTRLDGR
jgi:hypothetical protein